VKGIADTGFLVALLDRDDPHHPEAKSLLQTLREPFIVPLIVLPEVCYLAQKYLGEKAERGFIEGLLRGEMPLEWGEPRDMARAAEILHTRGELGFVDSMVIATAERLGIQKIATLDRRHFASFKPRHARAFEILP